MVESAEYYRERKRYYEDPHIAQVYDAKRFLTPAGQRRNRRKIAAIRRAIRYAAKLGEPIQCALDLPCGTGRIFPALIQEGIHFIGGDIALAMMSQAKRNFSDATDALHGFVQCDAERLPFKDSSFDAVFCIRFMFHVPCHVQIRILREMARVSRRWLIVDFRHRYTLRYLSWKLRHWLGLIPKLKYRFSKRDLEREVSEAGLRIARIFPTLPHAPIFSDKWVVLLEKDTVKVT